MASAIHDTLTFGLLSQSFIHVIRIKDLSRFRSKHWVSDAKVFFHDQSFTNTNCSSYIKVVIATKHIAYSLSRLELHTIFGKVWSAIYLLTSITSSRCKYKHWRIKILSALFWILRLLWHMEFITKYNTKKQVPGYTQRDQKRITINVKDRNKTRYWGYWLLDPNWKQCLVVWLYPIE